MKEKKFPIEKALVTGVAGFLGSNLAEALLELGHSVVGIDNFSTGQRQNIVYLDKLAQSLGKKFTFWEADVVSSNCFQDMPSSIDGISHVFHLASPASPNYYQKYKLETMWVNSVGLGRCLELAKRINARVIFSSTSEIYGDPLLHPQKENYWGNVNPFGPRSSYDESKRFGESLIYSHNEKYGASNGIVRIFNTYGPKMNRQDDRVIINFLNHAYKGLPIPIYGSGQQTRSFCFVSDLIKAFLAYGERDITEPINIGNDGEFTILQLFDEVQKLFPDRTLEKFFYSLPSDDPKTRRPDLEKAKMLLSPWKPEVSLQEGLQKTLAWLKDL